MPVQIPDHAHCTICGRAISAGEKACGDHVDKYEELQKKRKRAMYMMYGLMALAFVVLVISVYKPGVFGG